MGSAPSTDACMAAILLSCCRFGGGVSVLLVSHGLAIRLFLMRWLHWTVDEFLQVRLIEELRNFLSTPAASDLLETPWQSSVMYFAEGLGNRVETGL